MSVEELLNNGHFGLLAKPIKDYKDYIVTSLGSVWSKKSKKFLKPTVDTSGYLFVHLSKDGISKNKRVHTLVVCAFLNNQDEKNCVDHIDRDKTNNNINNLRYATKSENGMNREAQKNNKLQVKGVHKIKNKNSFRVQIKKNEKSYVKNFKKLEDAIKWRKQKEEELHGEFAYKN